MLGLLAGVLLGADPTPPDPYSAQGLTEEDRAAIEKGEVVVKGELHKTTEGQNAGRGVAYARAARDVEACWPILVDYGSHPEFMPRLERVTYLERTPERARATHEVRILWSTYRYTVALEFDAPRKTVAWSLDRSVKNDIKDTTGRWELLPLAGGATLIKYTVAVDTGMFVPRFLEEFLTRRDLPAILDNFRRRVESRGVWKKDD